MKSLPKIVFLPQTSWLSVDNRLNFKFYYMSIRKVGNCKQKEATCNNSSVQR